MKRPMVVLSVIFLVIVAGVTGAVLVRTYNLIVTAEKAVDEQKANIEAVCQRRLDMIPNLVATVKAYSQHERETLTATTQARVNAQSVLEKMASKGSLTREDTASWGDSQKQLDRTIKGVFALVENYPDLRASSNFLSLQDQLEGTENRINVARQRYNHAVKQYNSAVAMFPGTLVAAMLGLEEKASFAATDEAKKPVQVRF